MIHSIHSTGLVAMARFWGQSGHGRVRCKCLLLTQSERASPNPLAHWKRRPKALVITGGRVKAVMWPCQRGPPCE